jgi:hypothetical protein
VGFSKVLVMSFLIHATPMENALPSLPPSMVSWWEPLKKTKIFQTIFVLATISILVNIVSTTADASIIPVKMVAGAAPSGSSHHNNIPSDSTAFVLRGTLEDFVRKPFAN